MKILLATDGSGYSEEAARFIAALELSLNDEITVLAVMGTRGLRGIKGMLGSVSRYIINHAPCSVLIGKI